MNPSFNRKLPYWQKGDTGDIDFRPRNSVSTLIIFYGLCFVIVLGFVVIFLRLFQLTVVKGPYYRRLAEENRIREISIEAGRGKIIDRKGFVIADNARMAEKDGRIISRRLYPAAEALAHLVGYRQTADENDLKTDNCLDKLHLGDKVGKKGAEKLYECDLRGRDGKKLVEVDARGKALKTLTVIPPVNGKTVQLALDLELQKKAYEQIKDKKGAVVALKPGTNEILAFASSPSFNPQDFEDGNNGPIKNYLENKDKPLFNRVAEAVYPPGSVFKPVVAAGALETKTVDESFIVNDEGVIKAGPSTFGNWYFLQYGRIEGPVDMIKAIQRSNDIYFYKVGEQLKPEKIRQWAEILGYGNATGYGLDEAEGLLPFPFWKEEVLKEKWYLGDTYNYSIGQGYLLVTPLQVAQMTSVFANEGYLCQPQLLKTRNSKLETRNCKKLPIAEKTIKIIKEGMRRACATGGTGWPLFDFKVQSSKSKIADVNRSASGSANLASLVPIETACKTGTAESKSKDSEPHAWFTVFAPFEKPEIILTVLVEEGGQGSDIAGPIAKEILTKFFERTE